MSERIDGNQPLGYPAREHFSEETSIGFRRFMLETFRLLGLDKDVLPPETASDSEVHQWYESNERPTQEDVEWADKVLFPILDRINGYPPGTVKDNVEMYRHLRAKAIEIPQIFQND